MADLLISKTSSIERSSTGIRRGTLFDSDSQVIEGVDASLNSSPFSAARIREFMESCSFAIRIFFV